MNAALVTLRSHFLVTFVDQRFPQESGDDRRLPDSTFKAIG